MSSTRIILKHTPKRIKLKHTPGYSSRTLSGSGQDGASASSQDEPASRPSVTSHVLSSTSYTPATQPSDGLSFGVSQRRPAPRDATPEVEYIPFEYPVRNFYIDNPPTRAEEDKYGVIESIELIPEGQIVIVPNTPETTVLYTVSKLEWMEYPGYLLMVPDSQIDTRRHYTEAEVSPWQTFYHSPPPLSPASAAIERMLDQPEQEEEEERARNAVLIGSQTRGRRSRRRAAGTRGRRRG